MTLFLMTLDCNVSQLMKGVLVEPLSPFAVLQDLSFLLAVL